jgi:hypothetical protein
MDNILSILARTGILKKPASHRPPAAAHLPPRRRLRVNLAPAPRFVAANTGPRAGLALLVLAIGLSGCQSTMSPYSHTAYLQATSLKARSLRLMDRATGPVDLQRSAIEKLQTDLAAAREYAAGRPKNTLSTAQWNHLLDPSRHLLGGFLARWDREGSLGPTFIVEAKALVGEAFDAISGLESGKLGAPAK